MAPIYTPYPYSPSSTAAPSKTSSNAVGAVGTTSTPSSFSNGTVSSPTASAVPYTGAAASQDVDLRLILCVAIGLATAILLV